MLAGTSLCGAPVAVEQVLHCAQYDRATIILNREAARELFGAEAAAIGRELISTNFLPNRPPRTVVGVVDVVKQMSPDEPARMQVYIPQAQFTAPALTLVIRATGDAVRDARSLIGLVKRNVRAVNRRRPCATHARGTIWCRAPWRGSGST